MHMSYLLPCIAYKARTIATTTTQQQHKKAQQQQLFSELGLKTNLTGQQQKIQNIWKNNFCTLFYNNLCCVVQTSTCYHKNPKKTKDYVGIAILFTGNKQKTKY